MQKAMPIFFTNTLYTQLFCIGGFWFGVHCIANLHYNFSARISEKRHYEKQHNVCVWLYDYFAKKYQENTTTDLLWIYFFQT